MTTSAGTRPVGTASAGPPASVEPLRRALLRRADAAADALRAAAEREARAATDAAEQQAAAVLARARADGEADAAQRQAEDRARSRREARRVVLAAQRAVYDELRARARAAVRELLADPDAQRRLVALVRTRLGPDAQVRPLPSGGVVGELPDGRRVDASVDTLVEQALAGLDLAPLWATR
jgi:regulator of protease activity HflC (stomatin/prohibitin superfamily)